MNSSSRFARRIHDTKLFVSKALFLNQYHADTTLYCIAFEHSYIIRSQHSNGHVHAAREVPCQPSKRKRHSNLASCRDEGEQWMALMPCSTKIQWTWGRDGQKSLSREKFSTKNGSSESASNIDTLLSKYWSLLAGHGMCFSKLINRSG
jgi:hypothetical protein